MRPKSLTKRLAAALGLAAAACFSCGRVPALERRTDEAREVVAAVVRAPAAAAERVIGEGLAAALAGHAFLSGLTVARFGDEIFPPDDQLRLRAEGDPALGRYAELSAAERGRDFYLYDVGDGYWLSEYYAAGAPVRFKTDFLLHLEAAGDGATRVEVIEFLPRVWPGRVFRWLGHHGPDFYRDIRFVAPTTSDRLEVLRLVEGLFAGDGGAPRPAGASRPAPDPASTAGDAAAAAPLEPPSPAEGPGQRPSKTRF